MRSGPDADPDASTDPDSWAPAPEAPAPEALACCTSNMKWWEKLLVAPHGQPASPWPTISSAAVRGCGGAAGAQGRGTTALLLRSSDRREKPEREKAEWLELPVVRQAGAPGLEQELPCWTCPPGCPDASCCWLDRSRGLGGMKEEVPTSLLRSSDRDNRGFSRGTVGGCERAMALPGLLEVTWTGWAVSLPARDRTALMQPGPPALGAELDSTSQPPSPAPFPSLCPAACSMARPYPPPSPWPVLRPWSPRGLSRLWEPLLAG
ncbi:hypothetical protein V8C86DRAFT_2761124 [Haematococcus lacustris]